MYFEGYYNPYNNKDNIFIKVVIKMIQNYTFDNKINSTLFHNNKDIKHQFNSYLFTYQLQLDDFILTLYKEM